MTISCLIPFHNEGQRLSVVLREVIKTGGLTEIICVDDGSTDSASSQIKRELPSVKVITLPKNVGKTEAVRRGAIQAKGDFIVLLDADLRGLDHTEIEAAIQAMQNNAVDMIVLRRVNAPLTIKLARGDVLIPGERIIRRDDLLDVIQAQKPQGFQLELAINHYMMLHKKAVFWMPSSALNTWPTSKFSYLKGVWRIVSMQANILNYMGAQNSVRQWLWFARKRAEEISK